MITHAELITTLTKAFPELIGELRDETWAGLLHLGVACFARLTQSAIDNHEEALLKRCFAFADNAFRNADPEVKNAMSVSYLEHLNLSDTRQNRREWAFECMPPPLRDGFKEINAYLDQLFRPLS